MRNGSLTRGIGFCYRIERDKRFDTPQGYGRDVIKAVAPWLVNTSQANTPIDLATKTFAFLKPYADGSKG